MWKENSGKVWSIRFHRKDIAMLQSDLNIYIYFQFNVSYMLGWINFAANVENYFLVCGRKIAEEFGVSDFIQNSAQYATTCIDNISL